MAEVRSDRVLDELKRLAAFSSEDELLYPLHATEHG